MQKPINIQCPLCQHHWPISYEALQAAKVLHKGLEQRQGLEQCQGLEQRQEEYAIPCPRCGQTSVQTFTRKDGGNRHE